MRMKPAFIWDREGEYFVIVDVEGVDGVAVAARAGADAHFFALFSNTLMESKSWL